MKSERRLFGFLGVSLKGLRLGNAYTGMGGLRGTRRRLTLVLLTLALRFDLDGELVGIRIVVTLSLGTGGDA